MFDLLSDSVNINTSKANTDRNTKMTKSQLRSEIKNAIKTGLTIDEACDAVQYEFEMYAHVICNLRIDLHQKAMFSK